VTIHAVVIGNHTVILPASLHGCRGQCGDMGGGAGGDDCVGGRSADVTAGAGAVATGVGRCCWRWSSLG
jgi:hypothetical protein